MARADSIERGMAAVAEQVASPLPPGERAHAVLEALRQLVPYDCAALSIWHPSADSYRPLANADYPEHVYRELHRPRYHDEHVDLGMFVHRRPLCFRDLPDRGASLPSIADYAMPAGLREGLGLALFAPDGRRVGYLSLNTVTRRYPTERQRDAIGLLGPALGAVVDAAGALAARLGRDSAVALAASGAALPLPGGEPSPLLADGAVPLERARHLVAAGVAPAAFLWRTAPRAPWERVEVRPCDDGDLPGYTAIAAVAPPPETYGLTARELEVLTLMTRGETNGAIAERLVVSPRTVTTHVERILEKLGAATRAEAAVRAAVEGLLVWIGDEPPLHPQAGGS